MASTHRKTRFMCENHLLLMQNWYSFRQSVSKNTLRSKTAIWRSRDDLQQKGAL
jgi:hypothetical protein